MHCIYESKMDNSSFEFKLWWRAMCPNSWHDITACNGIIVITAPIPLVPDIHSRIHSFIHSKPHSFINFIVCARVPITFFHFTLVTAARIAKKRLKGMARTMGAATMLLQSFFITTLLFSTATALILNYTTRGCSKHCESINCHNARTIRYGKFCGVGYTGCPNQLPCDRLDACCRQHDFCVGNNPANFPNQTCRYNLRSCLQQYLATGAAVYHGSNCTAMTVQNIVMVAMESTTYHEHMAPGGAPHAGGAPKSVPAAVLDIIPTWAVIFGGLCACVLRCGL